MRGEKKGPNQNYRKTFIPKPDWNNDSEANQNTNENQYGNEMNGGNQYGQRSASTNNTSNKYQDQN
jgi:hypothetical protein